MLTPYDQCWSVTQIWAFKTRMYLHHRGSNVIACISVTLTKTKMLQHRPGEEVGLLALLSQQNWQVGDFMRRVSFKISFQKNLYLASYNLCGICKENKGKFISPTQGKTRVTTFSIIQTRRFVSQWSCSVSPVSSVYAFHIWIYSPHTTLKCPPNYHRCSLQLLILAFRPLTLQHKTSTTTTGCS